MSKIEYIGPSTETVLRGLYLAQTIRELCEITLPAQLQTRDIIVGQMFTVLQDMLMPFPFIDELNTSTDLRSKS